MEYLAHVLHCTDVLRLVTEYAWEFEAHAKEICTSNHKYVMVPSVCAASGKRFIGYTNGLLDFFDSGNATVLKTSSWINVIESVGQYLVTGAWDNTISVFRGRPFERVYDLRGHRGSVNDLVALSRTKFASASSDWTVRVWAFRQDRSDVLEGHSDSVNALAKLKDGRLASGSSDNTVRIWGKNGRCDMVLKGHSGGIKSLAALPCGGLASGAWDWKILMWGTDGILRHQLVLHTAPVTSLAALPDGSLISAAADKTLICWKGSIYNPTYMSTDVNVIALRTMQLSVMSLSDTGVLTVWV